MPRDSIAFLPALADINENLKIAITEADLYDYPGMFVKPYGADKIKIEFAPGGGWFARLIKQN